MYNTLRPSQKFLAIHSIQHNINVSQQSRKELVSDSIQGSLKSHKLLMKNSE